MGRGFFLLFLAQALLSLLGVPKSPPPQGWLSPRGDLGYLGCQLSSLWIQGWRGAALSQLLFLIFAENPAVQGCQEGTRHRFKVKLQQLWPKSRKMTPFGPCRASDPAVPEGDLLSCLCQNQSQSPAAVTEELPPLTPRFPRLCLSPSWIFPAFFSQHFGRFPTLDAPVPPFTTRTRRGSGSLGNFLQV